MYTYVLLMRKSLPCRGKWGNDMTELRKDADAIVAAAIAAALPGVPLIDTGAEVAKALKKSLAENNLCTARKTGELQFFVSDAPESFSAAAQIFLGQTIETVRRVTLIGQTLTPVQQ